MLETWHTHIVLRVTFNLKCNCQIKHMAFHDERSSVCLYVRSVDTCGVKNRAGCVCVCVCVCIIVSQ